MHYGTRRAVNGVLFAALLAAMLIIPRGADSARPRRRPAWRYIVIHHSATRKGNAFIMDRYHRNRRRMENGLAYHFVVNNGTSGTRDGEVEEGRRWRKQLPGGHCRQAWLNECGIGICLVGNFNRACATRKQMESLTALVDRLRRQYGIPVRSIKGHREFLGERTECPGRNFSMDRFRSRLRDADIREARINRGSGPGAALPGRTADRRRGAIPAKTGRPG